MVKKKLGNILAGSLVEGMIMRLDSGRSLALRYIFRGEKHSGCSGIIGKIKNIISRSW